MAINRYQELVCDGCDAYCDLDPIEIIGTHSVPDTIKDPKKITEINFFWVCQDCGEGGNTPQDFFTKTYFTEDELFLCENCGKFISEDELDGLGDVETVTCSTCSPKEESEA